MVRKTVYTADVILSNLGERDAGFNQGYVVYAV